MYYPVCINTGMIALPPRGPSSGQQLCKGRCMRDAVLAQGLKQERVAGKSLTLRPGAAQASSMVPHEWLGTSKLVHFPECPAKSSWGCSVPCRWMYLGAGTLMLTCGLWEQRLQEKLRLCNLVFSKNFLRRRHI